MMITTTSFKMEATPAQSCSGLMKAEVSTCFNHDHHDHDEHDDYDDHDDIKGTHNAYHDHHHPTHQQHKHVQTKACFHCHLNDFVVTTNDIICIEIVI